MHAFVKSCTTVLGKCSAWGLAESTDINSVGAYYVITCILATTYTLEAIFYAFLFRLKKPTQYKQKMNHPLESFVVMPTTCEF